MKWRPEYPNPAFDNMRPDDAFWGARLVATFTDERIRAIVAKARYSDPAATDYIAQTLIARRDKVLKAWLTGVNPIVDPSLEPGRHVHLPQRSGRRRRGDAPGGLRSGLVSVR